MKNLLLALSLVLSLTTPAIASEKCNVYTGNRGVVFTEGPGGWTSFIEYTSFTSNIPKIYFVKEIEKIMNEKGYRFVEDRTEASLFLDGYLGCKRFYSRYTTKNNNKGERTKIHLETICSKSEVIMRLTNSENLKDYVQKKGTAGFLLMESSPEKAAVRAVKELPDCE